MRQLRFRPFRNLRKGFTLIELLLVIAIIGVLAGLIIPRYVNRAEKAKLAAARADIEGNLAAALELYELDVGRFPSTSQGIQALVEEPTLPPMTTGWSGPYLRGRKYSDPWGNPYEYEFPSSRPGYDYDLVSLGPDAIRGSDDDIFNGQE